MALRGLLGVVVLETLAVVLLQCRKVAQRTEMGRRRSQRLPPTKPSLVSADQENAPGTSLPVAAHQTGIAWAPSATGHRMFLTSPRIREPPRGAQRSQHPIPATTGWLCASYGRTVHASWSSRDSRRQA